MGLMSNPAKSRSRCEIKTTGPVKMLLGANESGNPHDGCTIPSTAVDCAGQVYVVVVAPTVMSGHVLLIGGDAVVSLTIWTTSGSNATVRPPAQPVSRLRERIVRSPRGADTMPVNDVLVPNARLPFA